MNIAIVVLAGTETHEGLGRIVNALETAKEAREAGDRVQMIFDGAGAEGLAAISAEDHKLHPLYLAVQDTIHGVCSFCANAFHVREQIAQTQIPLLDEYEDHPSLRRLFAEGYQVLTF